MGRFLAALILLVIIVVGLAWALGLVNFQQTRDARLPSVNVSGGQAPKFEANVADVSVGVKNETVRVPTVELNRPGN